MFEKRKLFYSATGSYFAIMSSTVPPTPPDSPPVVATPCTRVCIVDGATSLCLGCWRTLAEISGWSGFPETERARIMAELPGRATRGG